MKMILLPGAPALAGCASNGNGLIGAGGGTSSGCFTTHDAGQRPRTICTK